MKFASRLDLGILGEPDSPELWQEMIDKIDIKPKMKFLNVACGHCTEAKVLAKALVNSGHYTKEQALDAIYLIDKYKMFTEHAKFIGFKNVVTDDFLTWKPKMEFDVTLMNPPYSKGLWMKFIEKALEMNTPIIATINPDPANLCAGGFGEKWKNICIENGIVYRNEVSHYFPNVNSGNIGAFVLNRNESPNLELIESGNPIFESIYSKVTTAEPTSFALRGSLRESKGEESTLSDNETDTHVHPCIMNCKSEGLLIKYSDQLKVSKKHAGKLSGQYVIINRFFGKNTPEKTPAFPIDNIEDYNLGNNCIAFKLEAGETLENFMSVYTNKVFRYVMVEMRNGGMDIQTRHLMSFLRLDLTKFWTDDDIYTHFNLTQEEIEHVEANV